ncbi:MAG: flagellar biosynthesis protein FlhB [Alphaproteobacteria bacterium]|nr:flagellar biosynthesis protein FlhB [Alphaproteobacteria bacterium]
MVTPEEDEASKTEEPSERKISKAKEEGDVAISQEAKSFIMLLGMLFVIWLILPIMFKWYYQISINFIESAGQIEITPGTFKSLFKHSTLGLFKILSLPFLIFIILGVLASISQTGFIYAPKKIEPNWNKLNIFAALPNFINMKKVVESLKGIIKITIISFIAILVVKPYLKKVDLLPSMETMGILSFIHKIIVLLLFTVVIAVLIIAIADYLYQRFAHLKKLRMTKQEVKDEYKQMEGDPLIKSRIRQVRMERARHRMMEAVPRSDVVIVNPTHYAVALEYKMEEMDAPKVTAKGMDNIALRIKSIAEDNDIPIVENPPLARALFASTEIDQTIPQEHFKAVAEVITYVMQLKNQQPAG